MSLDHVYLMLEDDVPIPPYSDDVFIFSCLETYNMFFDLMKEEPPF